MRTHDQIRADIAASEARIIGYKARNLVLMRRIRHTKVGIGLSAIGLACVFVSLVAGIDWLMLASLVPSGVSLAMAVWGMIERYRENQNGD